MTDEKCLIEVKSWLESLKKDSEAEIEEAQKELEKRFPKMSYDYTSYGTVDDRWLIIDSDKGRYKLGGTWNIEGWWESAGEQFVECTGKPAKEPEEAIENLSDLVGEVAELDTMKNLMEGILDLPDDILEEYRSEE